MNFYNMCKLNNYGYIKGNLHVKFVVNSSPSFYGSAIAAYYPKQDFKAGQHAVNLANEGFFTPMSQRMHIWLRPQQSQGGELVLPFVNNKNWINLHDENEITNFGSIFVSSIKPLRNASGVTGGSIDITAFAWMTEVELAQTTSRLLVTPPPSMIAQSAKVKIKKDEFTQGYTGPVSSVASTVATVAGRLSDAPVIGPFAKAFEIGGKAVAGIASIFGFSRIPIVKPILPTRNNPITPLAITDQPEPVDRLVFSSKQGLTVDPRTVGIGAADELSISSIATRESFLTTFEWAESAAIKTILFGCIVGPNLSQYYTPELYMTPMAFAALPFKYWSGDIIYRFQIVCSQFHRGRLLIQYDPVQFTTFGVHDPQMVLSQVIDISVTRDFEFRVPYASDRSFLEVDSPLSGPQYDTDDVGSIDRTKINGKFHVSVLNRLTSLSGSGDIYVIVSVRAAENMKFACPKPIPDNYNLYPKPAEEMMLSTSVPMIAQSGVVDLRLPDEGIPVSTTEVDLVNTPTQDDHIFDVYFGEQVVSFRALLRRYMFSGTFFPTYTHTSGGHMLWNTNMPRFPIPHGYLPSCYTRATNGATPAPYGYTPMTLFNYLQNCYLGMRGGMRWKVMNGNTSIGWVMFARSDTPRNNVYSVMLSVPATTTQGNLNQQYSAYLPNPWMGSGIIPTSLNNSAEFEIPHYSSLRFYSTCPGNIDKGDIVSDGSNVDSMRICIYHGGSTITTNPVYVFHTYCSIGDDFNFFWFQGVPTFYIYDVPTPTTDRPA